MAANKLADGLGDTVVEFGKIVPGSTETDIITTSRMVEVSNSSAYGLLRDITDPKELLKLKDKANWATASGLKPTYAIKDDSTSQHWQNLLTTLQSLGYECVLY